jgi:hypothetical protein
MGDLSSLRTQIHAVVVLAAAGVTLAVAIGQSGIADRSRIVQEPGGPTSVPQTSSDPVVARIPIELLSADEPARLAAQRGVTEVVGPDSCGGCDPDNVDNPESGGFDPTILAVYQEDDLLPAPAGPGTPTCETVTTFWAGANDHCSGVPGVPGRDPTFLDSQLPPFSAFGQRYLICGQGGNINTSGFTGDPANPGAPLNSRDWDVWAFEVVQPMDIRITAYAESESTRVAVAFSFDNGPSIPIQSCTDRYAASSTWSTGFIDLNQSCPQAIRWSEPLQPGYYYIVARIQDPAGNPMAQTCGRWYNIVIESLDAIGGCCIGTTCTDGVTRTACEAACGRFLGDESSCQLPCDALAGACCFRCASTVNFPCPDPSGPPSATCFLTNRVNCESRGGVFVGGACDCGGSCNCIADVNGDNMVTAADFTILAGSFGSSGPACVGRQQGDLNCDGIVNAADFTILAGDFGCAP